VIDFLSVSYCFVARDSVAIQCFIAWVCMNLPRPRPSTSSSGLWLHLAPGFTHSQTWQQFKRDNCQCFCC